MFKKMLITISLSESRFKLEVYFFSQYLYSRLI